jgi:hypothetical protein
MAEEDIRNWQPRNLSDRQGVRLIFDDSRWEKTMNRRVQATLLLLLTASCGGERPATVAWRAERDTAGDTIIVRTLSGSVWAQPRTLVERASVGKADGDDVDLLGGFRAIAVAPDGSIYVSDGGPVLRKYAADGHYLATFGRKGGGPGEYANPDGGLAVLSDGRVLIRDPGNGRITVFDSSGTYLTMWRIPAGFFTSRKLFTDTAGRALTWVVVDPDKPFEERRTALEHIGDSGAGDTVIAPTWDVTEANVSGQSKNMTNISSVPFTAEAKWTFSALGYFVGGVNDRYHITLYRSGRPLTIERTVSPVPVESAEAAEKKASITRQFQQNFPSWSWNGPDIPDTKPLFTEIFAGDDGRIWVQLSQPGHPAEADNPSDPPEWKEPVVFDVFEADGRYLGQVSAPEGFLQYPSPVFRGDTIWAGFEDADGVRYVKRFEVGAER